MKTSLFIVLLWIVRAAGAESLPFYTENDFTPTWDKHVINSTPLARMPDFQMKNQASEVLTQKNFHDKIAVVNFFYASCGSVCPMLMDRMKKVNEDLSSSTGVEMVSFTITPALDTPEKLNNYAKKRNLQLERWSLLTGTAGELRKVEKAFQANKDVASRKNGEVVHSENIYLLDRTGKVRGIYNASSAGDLKLLTKDVLALAKIKK